MMASGKEDIKPCPNCGHCPTCGHSARPPLPSYNDWWFSPRWQYVPLYPYTPTYPVIFPNVTWTAPFTAATTTTSMSGYIPSSTTKFTVT